MTVRRTRRSTTGGPSGRTAAITARRSGRFRRVLAEMTLRELGALVLAAISVVLFSLLARAVLHEEFAAFNSSVLEKVHEYSTPTLDTLSMAVTRLGSFECVVLIGGLFVWWFLRTGRRIDAWVIAVVLVGGGALSQTLKTIFAQSRPDVFDPLYRAAGLSFPSGHSLIAYTLYGFIAVWLLSANVRTPWRWFGAVLSLLIATAVAASRLYIGVHWPSDVVGGLFVATFWLATCFLGRQIFRRRLAVRLSKK